MKRILKILFALGLLCIGAAALLYPQAEWIPVWPSSSTDNAIPRWDGTGADALKDSGVTIDDNNHITTESAGGASTGLTIKATGSGNYASMDYLNDSSTYGFQTGMYGTTHGSANKAFFFNNDGGILFGTDSTPGGAGATTRVEITGAGKVEITNVSGIAISGAASSSFNSLDIINNSGGSGLQIGLFGSTHATYAGEGFIWNSTGGLTFGVDATPGGSGITEALIIDVDTTVNLPIDNQKLTMGAAGATDYYQEFDGTDAQFYTSGDFAFSPVGKVSISKAVDATQFRIEYDSTHGVDFRIRSGGGLKITPTSGTEFVTGDVTLGTGGVGVSNNASFKGKSTAGNYRQMLRIDPSDVIEIGSQNAELSRLSFSCGGVDEGLVMKETTGYVGIQTLTPDAQLQVVGDCKFGDDNTNYASFASDGELTFTGTARVTEFIWLNAGGIKAPGAKPATFVELGLTGVWQFADAIEANQESVSGTLKIPASMDITVAPTFHIGWSADGVSPGDCEWQLEYLWLSPNEATDAAAQETLTVASTASGTSNGFVFATITGIDLPSATDKAMLWKVTRLSAGNDDIADTTEMRGAALQFTRDKLGDPL